MAEPSQTTLVFPIPQFVRIPADKVVDALNDVIVSVNWAIVNAGALGGTGLGTAGNVSQNQFFAALTNGGYDVNLVFQALNPDMNVAATRQFYTSPIVIQGSALSNLAQTTLGLTTPQMTTIFANAAVLPPWS